jgi:hypothetical protein
MMKRDRRDAGGVRVGKLEGPETDESVEGVACFAFRGNGGGSF